MADKFFVISMSEDGEWSFSEFETMAGVTHCYGLDEDPEQYKAGQHPAESFKASLADEQPGRILIKGHVLMPKAVAVKTAWKFVEDEG